jgi:ABC-2 type transport system permease protein
MALVQSLLCFLVAGLLGMQITLNVLLAVVVSLPAALLFIGIGLLCGSVFNDKQVGGICGALLTNLSAWLSGTWFDLNLVGGVFKKIAYLLPFAHAVDAGRAAVSGDLSNIMPHLWWVIGYSLVVLIIAVLVFRKKMHQDGE